METFGELIIKARKKAKGREATVTAQKCSCSVTVSFFSKRSSVEHYEKCAEHEDRPRVLAARGY